MEASVWNHNASDIQELSIDELDEVNGGLPVLAVAVIVVVSVIVVGFAAGAISGYVANKE